ncbi:MAG: nucleotidyltransferase domain-containing protein [Nitrospira sp.]|nr:nucleotidyltransferase domain-containing protein [Nitrospira sp.]
MENNIKTMNKVSISEVIKKLKETLTMHSDIVLVFLFGSFVRGDITSFSDLDIAIYFTSTVDFYRINDLREDISALLGIDVDIVVLNNASPVIKMQVLKKGTMLINKDRRTYNEFFVNTVKEYDDLKRTRKEIEEKILRGRIYA